MFRDCKRSGYKLKGTAVSGERLITMILLIAIAYSNGGNQFGEIKQQMSVQKYVANLKWFKRF